MFHSVFSNLGTRGFVFADKVNDTGVPWDYRICFNSDVVAWAPKPFLQRIDLGWYNSSYDEDHPNGSVSLHYVNSITRREVALQCHCGQGPEITSWTTGHNHTLHLALPTCCRLAHEDGARPMSVPEIFHWLLAPVARLEQPCLGLKRGSWDYTLCFEENISQASLSRSPATAEGKVPPEVLLAGPPPPEVVPRLVTAEPVVRGQSVGVGAGLSSEDGSAAWAAVPAKLTEALGSQRRRALELDLAEGQDCRAANGTRKHRVRVRWLCPATWRSTAPDLDGGHSALLAVERPSGDLAESVGCCDWVVWVTSTLLCTWRPLRPAASSAQEVQCQVEQQVR
ncbi:unnamed protein product [Cladocopium goreaui]|uniref:Uncharacterized protein n=1 Tax=Cladocopium goreaui TaxID=2562237 RepID=A0A9P1CCP5_9DINO|nr:unnamed protein product [Cladocopium goreaui]